MPDFNFLLLYVDDPAPSAAFYADLLAAPIVEQSPTFAMLPLRDGVMLGLWSRHTVEPKSAAAPGGERDRLRGGGCRRRRGTACRLETARPDDRPGADAHGLRHDLRRGRSRRTSAACLRARGRMKEAA